MRPLFPQFDVDYIAGVMSLRKPQKISLKRLADILEEVPPSKTPDLEKNKGIVHNLFPTFTDFERSFMSITFALATGVGKTRLMGAFITYLYCQYGYRNFFIVAPNLTIYNKLKSDLGDPASRKYVFHGCGCFSKPPHVYADDEYRQKPLDFSASDINLFVFNIDKFNSEDASMRALNEYLGQSFYDTLAGLDDLVMLMDESHHYRAKSGAAALNDLKPILGLELTATPLVTSGSKQIPFKNVVYEYPLSQAISDGYTRTPYAVGRADIDCYNFGEEQLDKMMLLDGIKCHERAKLHLRTYAENHGKPVVKPFMLVVCKDTEHAQKILDFIRSKEFRDGRYMNKTITIHSKQSGAERDENIKYLLEVENPDNPVEIVIHVNVLKEGWDVNNLYTIVPLRTAASKILREQTVGRGLRLPYGERTGDKDVDAVMLTAHDHFADVVEEAQKGCSIFHAGNVIQVHEDDPEEQSAVTQPSIIPETDKIKEDAYAVTGVEQSAKNDAVIEKISKTASSKIMEGLRKKPGENLTESDLHAIAKEVEQSVTQDRDLGETFLKNADPFHDWIPVHIEKTVCSIESKYIPIPRIKVSDYGAEEYIFSDFELDLQPFNHVPISNDLLVQNLQDMSDRIRIDGDKIDFEGFNPIKTILELLREKPEIDYESCSELLFKLIKSVVAHYISKFGENGVQNIVMMYRRDISEKIYEQMMRHFSCGNSLIQESVVALNKHNLPNNYTFVARQSLWDPYVKGEERIKSILFDRIEKGVFSEAKFDSEPELIFARVLEQDSFVKNWLRPAPCQFNLTYNRNHQYIPDFVVETENVIYLVEVKGEDKMKDADVLAKKKRGVQYCRTATMWGKANGYKEWQYLFIPSKQVTPQSTFEVLCQRFAEMNTDGTSN